MLVGIGNLKPLKFILTIDTEADYLWKPDTPVTVRNIRCIPRLQALCERYGFPPTYLCTYDIVSSTEFDEVLLPIARRGTAEVGAHLHPWSNPPFDPDWDVPGRSFPYPSELPAPLVRQKLEHLTAAIKEKLGAAPRSYRAGRWGFSAPQISTLLDLGYAVDCSVTPHVSWQDAGGRGHGQDFSQAPEHPYFLAYDDPCRSGSSQLLEVPVTILYTNSLMRQWSALQVVQRRYRKTAAARVLNRFFRIAPQWFRPFWDMDAHRLKTIFEAARDRGLPGIEMMFHSYVLMPEGSLHSPTASHVERLFARLEEVFEYLVTQGVEGCMLTTFAEQYRLRAKTLES